MPLNRNGAGGWKRLNPTRILLRLGLAVALVLAGLLTLAFIDGNWRFAHMEAAAPARVFSAPFVLAEDVAIVRDDLQERLGRLGYRKVEGHPATPGEYSVRFRSTEIYLNAFEYPWGKTEATPLRVKTSFGRVSHIENLESGENLDQALLEPESLGTLSGNVTEERLAVSVDDLPKTLLDAVIAIEDRRFKGHTGIDPRATLRALFANVKSGEVVQGGSTITQQLAKNLYPGGERTFPRKIWEALAAVGLEAFHSKDEILERYLNQIYLAQRGPTSIIGVGAASQHYFGKDVRYLDLPESALLAGLIQSPGRYHPYRHPREARERRNLALKLMLEEGLITKQQQMDAAATPLALRPEPASDGRHAPYFIDYIAQRLQEEGLRDPASHTGMRVFTTLDPLIQARAEKVIAASLAQYEKDYRHLRPLPGGELQGAFVALRPSDGSILAMVGGRNYARSQFNRIAQAHRQPGSAFKPFVYLAGFLKAQSEHTPLFTAATVLDDSPLEMEVNGEAWAPQNFDQEYRGPVSARQALAESLNVPTIRAAEMIGLRDIVRSAHQDGIESTLQAVPSIALGTFEIVPLELASAYTTIANLGTRVLPRALVAVVDDGGKTSSVPVQPSEQSSTPQAAYLTLDLMRDVVRKGTGAGIWSYGVQGEFAGKTGTTDEGRDAWFVGFSPDFLGLAWVGFDNNRPLRLGGAVLALPIWAQIARGAGIDDDRRWKVPPGIVELEIDPTTGQQSQGRCPDSVTEIFIEGTEPPECETHRGGMDSWVTRLVNWFSRD
ncbi:MAG TPA: PBP1A family penicillin-binding protein [Candidatus Polarisedimenticolia bacterium]|jgi:penicillin-binding protein 1B|nr:PBP1A family penicillin-binding protein [Candidatus Polarisedimenticolia bacterium]